MYQKKETLRNYLIVFKNVKDFIIIITIIIIIIVVIIISMHNLPVNCSEKPINNLYTKHK